MQAIDTTLTSSLVFRRPLYDVVAVPSSNPKNNKNGASKGPDESRKSLSATSIARKCLQQVHVLRLLRKSKVKQNMKQPMATHGSAYPLH